MDRRDFIAGSAAAAATFTAPRIARAASSKVLRYIPQADLAVLDPVWTTAFITRTHGMQIFDTLFGVDNAFQPQPQMVEGFTTSADRQGVGADASPRPALP